MDDIRTSERRDARVDVKIRPGSPCPLTRLGGNVREVERQFSGERCSWDFLVSEPDDDDPHVAHTETAIQDTHCACSVFEEYDCVANITDVVDSAFLVRTFVRDRTVVWDLVDGLRDVCEEVELLRITTTDTDESERLVDVDLSTLTSKQHETLEHAFREGYYQRPRQASLEDLAQGFDISKQALYQRLSAAENKVIAQLFAP
jgi:hypothetical protein